MTRRNHTLRGIFQFFGVLTVLLSAAALAQVKGAGQASVKRHAVSALPDAGSAGHVSGSHAPENPLAASPLTVGATLFLPVVTYDAGGLETSSVAVADVNGDGKPDLVVANSGDFSHNGSVAVLLGNGDGTFQPAVTYNSGGQTFFVTVADLNGDGKLDLVVANHSGTAVGALLGNGDGTFQPVVGYGSGGMFPLAVVVADVNGDGKPDLLVGNLSADSSGHGSVGVLLGNGNGTFQTAVPYLTGGLSAFSLAAADVNGDGKADVLIATQVEVCNHCTSPGAVAVLLGNGDGSFQSAVLYPSGAAFAGGPGFRPPVSVAVEDVNDDGKPDVVVENSQCCGTGNGLVGVLLGSGDGTFQAVVTYPSGAGGDGSSAAVADVDGDGRPDLVVTDWTAAGKGIQQGLVGVLLGNGDGTFRPVVTYNSGGFLTNWVAVADVNGDGRPDLVVANACAVNTSNCERASVGVLLNNTGPHTPTTTTLVSSANPASVSQIVTYTASVTTQSGGTATGVVVFQDGGLTIGTVTVVGNQAAFSTKLKIGIHPITATYTSDQINGASTSNTLAEEIRGASKTVVKTSGSPSLVGQPVTFTATVTSTFGTIPNGEIVTFYDGTTAVGTGTTASGVAAFTTSSLTAKTHTVKATYAGDVKFGPSAAVVTQIVNKYSTTTALSSSPNPSIHGQAVIFKATVTSSGPNPPTGTVKFLDGTTLIGTATLGGATAKLTKSTLAAGTHPITAQYMGDAPSGQSTSPVVNQVVQ